MFLHSFFLINTANDYIIDDISQSWLTSFVYILLSLSLYIAFSYIPDICLARICIQSLMRLPGSYKINDVYKRHQQVTIHRTLAATGYLQSVLSHTSDGVITYNQDGVIVSLNPSAEKILGYSAEEVIGNRITGYCFCGMEEKGACWDTNSCPLSVLTKEIKGRHKSGRMVPMAAAVIMLEVKGTKLWMCFIRDISSKKAQEKQQELFALASKTTQDGIWDLDITSGALWLSPRWKQMLGYRENELENCQTTIKALMLAEDYEYFCKLADNHIRYNIPFQGVFRFHHKDGGIRHIMSRTHTLTAECGQPVRMVGTHTDLTEMITLQEKLADSEATCNIFSRCFPGMACRFISTPEEPFTITYISEQVKEICGLSPEEIYENSALLLQIAHPEDKEKLLEAAKHAITTWKSWNHQYRIIRHGRICWLSAQFMPVKHTDNSVTWEGTVMDITAFREV